MYVYTYTQRETEGEGSFVSFLWVFYPFGCLTWVKVFLFSGII